MQFLKNVFELVGALFKAGSSTLFRWVQPREAARRRFEIERLDRLRHPSKYRGK
jgi:hypothetical protein